MAEGKEDVESESTVAPDKDAQPPTPEKPEEGQSPDFRYIVRIANTDLDGKRSVTNALTGIKGVGIRLAEIVADLVEISRNEKIGNLPEAKTAEIEQVLTTLHDCAPSWVMNRQKDWETGDDFHIFGSDLSVKLRDDINLMKKIRCYKGIRHEQGQKVRGQRTRSNGRTGLTIGVVKKAAVAAAQAKEKEGKEKKE